MDVLDPVDEERGDCRNRGRIRRQASERDSHADEGAHAGVSRDRPKARGRPERESPRDERRAAPPLRFVEGGAKVVDLPATAVMAALRDGPPRGS